MKIHNHEKQNTKKEEERMEFMAKETCPVVKSNGNGNYKQNHQMVIREREGRVEMDRTFNGASFHNLWLPRMNADRGKNVVTLTLQTNRIKTYWISFK